MREAVEREAGEHLEQAADRVGVEDDRVLAGLQARGLGAGAGRTFARGGAGDRGAVEVAPASTAACENWPVRASLVAASMTFM